MIKIHLSSYFPNKFDFTSPLHVNLLSKHAARQIKICKIIKSRVFAIQSVTFIYLPFQSGSSIVDSVHKYFELKTPSMR